MFTCLIRYEVAPGKVREFEEYARAWMRLIERHGGTHHGYFLPPEGEVREASFSFPGLGRQGPPNLAVALFSFASVEKYDAYRRAVAEDPGCKAATARFEETRCFLG